MSCNMTHPAFFPGATVVNPPQKGRPRKRKNQQQNPDNDIFSHGLGECLFIVIIEDTREGCVAQYVHV